MIFMFITNNPDLAEYAVSCGVNRIFVDMEYLGKDIRQGHLDTHMARHSVSDVRRIRKRLPNVELLARINPLYEGSSREIEELVASQVDIIMLPMFTNELEVEEFIQLVNGRAKICLLLETSQALVRIDSILRHADRIDEIHIGLNDLHLGLGVSFMFEILTGGIVEYLAQKIQPLGIVFGFGGIARIGEGMVPAELILGEHVRLGSSMVILSRTFHQNAKTIEELKEKINLQRDIVGLKNRLEELRSFNSLDLQKNRELLRVKVDGIVKAVKSPNGKQKE